MRSMISCCGIDCVQCPAHVATMKNDAALRAKTAAEWSKMFGAEIKPEHINCKGCRTATGVQISHCSVCEIRKCVTGKKIRNCATCADYACSKLDFIFTADPKTKERLDEIRKKAK